MDLFVRRKAMKVEEALASRLALLRRLVRRKVEQIGLREAAIQVALDKTTLWRFTTGKTPTLLTYVKLCQWTHLRR